MNGACIHSHMRNSYAKGSSHPMLGYRDQQFFELHIRIAVTTWDGRSCLDDPNYTMLRKSCVLKKNTYALQ